jgi:hypothetical protein
MVLTRLTRLWHWLTRPVFRCVTWLTTDVPCSHCGHGLSPALTDCWGYLGCGKVWNLTREKGDPCER